VVSRGSTRRLGISPNRFPTQIQRCLGRYWPTDEPPLTQFAARQLSVAHWFDQRDTQRALRWQPMVSVDEGIRRLSTWFQEHDLST